MEARDPTMSCFSSCSRWLLSNVSWRYRCRRASRNALVRSVHVARRQATPASSAGAGVGVDDPTTPTVLPMAAAPTTNYCP